MRRIQKSQRPPSPPNALDTPSSRHNLFHLSYLLLFTISLAVTEGFCIPPPVDQRHSLKDRPNKAFRTGLRIGWPDELASIDLSTQGDLWQSGLSEQVYVSPLLWKNNLEWKAFIHSLNNDNSGSSTKRSSSDKKDRPVDHVWEQIKLEAVEALRNEPEAGPQLYQGILSQGSLLEAVVTIVARTYTPLSFTI
jgi:hypothetical protein